MATRLTIEKVGESLKVDGTIEIADFRKAVTDARADLGEPLLDKFESLVSKLTAN